MDTYELHGFSDRHSYFQHLSKQYRVPLYVVIIVASLVGPDNEFDALPFHLEQLNESGVLEVIVNKAGTRTTLRIGDKVNIY